MAQAADQRTPKTLDDAARFLIEERGYEKNPALCWEILEQIWAGRITLRRHWKKYDLNGNPQEDGTEVVNRAVFRNLDFDRHGHIRPVPEWGDDRFTIVEPCDFRIIWPPHTGQTAPEQRPEDSAGPDPVKLLRTGAAEAKPLAPSKEPTATSAPKKKRRKTKQALGAGAPEQHDWEEGELFVMQELKTRGNPLDKNNQTKGWKTISDVARLVIDHLKKLSKDENYEGPDLSTTRGRVSGWIKKFERGHN